MKMTDERQTNIFSEMTLRKRKPPARWTTEHREMSFVGKFHERLCKFCEGSRRNFVRKTANYQDMAISIRWWPKDWKQPLPVPPPRQGPAFSSRNPAPSPPTAHSTRAPAFKGRLFSFVDCYLKECAGYVCSLFGLRIDSRNSWISGRRSPCGRFSIGIFLELGRMV